MQQPLSTHSSQSETELIEAARAGDGAALETLLERVQGRLFRFSLRMSGNIEDAEEVLQETLLTITRSLNSFRGDSRLTTWAFSIARHAFGKRKRKSERVSFAEADASLQESPNEDRGQEAKVREREILGALDAALNVLDEDSRAVLLLRDIEGLSAQETANALGMSIPQVKSRIHRARARLREHMLPTLTPATPTGRTAQPGCPDIVSMFSRYLEEEVDADMCREMQEHVESCDFCERTCESLKRTVAVCNAIPAPEIPRGVQTSVRHYIRRHVDASQSDPR